MIMNKENINSYFILSSSCVLTKGFSRTLIQDFIRNYADYVPNDFYSLALLLNRHRISDILEMISEESQNNFFAFVDFMLEKEYAFLTDNIALFPPISDNMNDDYEIITDAILEIDERKSDMNIVKCFLYELNNIECRNLQLRLFSFSSILSLRKLFDFVCRYNFNYIEIHVDNAELISYEEGCCLLYDYAQISNLFLYNASKSVAKDYFERGNGTVEMQLGSVVFITDKLVSCNCGIINKYCHVYDNRRFYFMSKKFNSCLYKKVSLDMWGNVRNCPSTSEKYSLSRGLRNIVQSNKFQQYWFIKKDDIDICKDCEFRYNCLDCRAHTVNGNVYAKPIKCQYNPYEINRETKNKK